jgi:hypothetical protein
MRPHHFQARVDLLQLTVEVIKGPLDLFVLHCDLSPVTRDFLGVPGRQVQVCH